MDVNAPYVGLEWEYVYQVIMGCLVFLIVPGIGLLYGGMARRKSALAMIFQSITVMAVCTFQWAFWGFSLAFSRNGGPFIGDLTNFGLKDVSGVLPMATSFNTHEMTGHGCSFMGICCHPRYRLLLLRTHVLCMCNNDRGRRIL